jgi:hypothetical protein
MVATASRKGRSPDRRGTGRNIRGPLGALTCAALLLTGCNSGAVNGSGSDDGGSGGNGNGGRGGGNGGGGPGGDRYGFGLPSGPTSGDAPAGVVYDDIRTGQCGQAQRDLESQQLDDGTSYSTLLKVGIALCRNDTSTARSLLTGLSRPEFESGTWFLCELYRASESVVHQRPRSAFGTCPPPPVVSPDTSPSDDGGSAGSEDSAGPSEAPEPSSGTGG